MLRIPVFAIAVLMFMLPARAQSPDIGQPFPPFLIRDLLNGSKSTIDVRELPESFVIINFWGTWCSPCLPEMDSLRLLQKKYANKLRVIAVANDPIDRLRNYLEKKPTPVWVSSDTSFYMYQFFGFDYVGQSVVLDQDRQILAFVRTDSINDLFLQRLIAGHAINSSAERSVAKKSLLDEEDPFPVDSQRAQRWVFESFRPGSPSMMRTYPNGPFQGRRLSFLNVCPDNVLRTAFNISTPALVKYELSKSDLCDFSTKKGMFCFDLIVAPQQRDSLYQLLQLKLADLFPFQFRLEKQLVPVYVLKASDTINLTKSQAQESQSYFSGRGFTGAKIGLGVFADYLSNELSLPVVDETGLKGEFDIQTSLVERSQSEVKKSVRQLGLNIEKAERMQEVLIISDKPMVKNQ